MPAALSTRPTIGGFDFGGQSVEIVVTGLPSVQYAAERPCVRNIATLHAMTLEGGFELVEHVEFTRQCMVLAVRRSMKALDVVDLVSEAMKEHGLPKHLRSDNGPEFIAAKLRSFLSAAEVGTLYVAPGSPCENGYAESFHGKLRDEEGKGVRGKRGQIYF